MKKIIIVAITLLALTSCSNSYIEDGKNLVKNQKELTNIEILSKIDTTNMYYVIIEDSKLHTINSKTKIIEHKIIDTTGALFTLLIFLILLISILIAITSIL